MAPQVREIRVVVDTKGADGLKNVADGFKNVNTSIQKTTTVLSAFKNAFLAIQGLRFAGFGVSEITSASDSYQKLSDRIKVFEGSQEKANDTMAGLARVADNTRSAISGVATVYSRLALSLSETNIGSKNLLFITEQLQNSFRLSGSTAGEATAATIQLSQGLASGTLRGQELRSVLESNALIGELLAKQLNTTRGNLLKLAEAGKITSDVFLKALGGGASKLNADAQQLGVTFQEATDRGINKFNVALGQLNQRLGISNQFDKFVQGATDNLGAFGAVAVGLAISAIPALITGLNNLTIAMYTFAASNPVLLIFTALGALAAYAYFETDKYNEIILKLRQNFLILAADVGEKIYGIVKSIDTLGGALSGGFLTKFSNESIQGFKDLRTQAVKDLKAIEQASADIARGNYVEQNVGVQTFEQQLQAYKKSLASLGNFGVDPKVKTLQNQIKELNASFADGGIPVEAYNKKLVQLSTDLYKKKGPIPLANELNKLQKENLGRLFEYGIIGAQEFQDTLAKINVDQLEEKFKKGRITQLEYLQESDKLRNRIYEVNQEFRDRAIIGYNQDLKDGTVTLDQYRAATQQLAVDKLNDQFKAGKIDIYAYNKALTETSDKFLPGSALSTGLQNYIQSAGTLSQNISNAVTNTFGNLENAMVEFTKNGKFQFKQFALAVLEDLNRIIIRSLIIRPLAQGILGAITPSAQDATNAKYSGVSASAGSGVEAAHGAAFDGGRTNFFADGGVVSSRTSFSYSGGKKGVMGEAGPEAILPLKRNASGDLGVQAGGSSVIVNINNQSGGDVEQKESKGPNGERVLDIIITQKVKEAFANGSMDKQMSSNYGLRRKGQ